MKEQFIEKNFRAASVDLIIQVNSILDTYEAQGYSLTLRQLYYQLVAKNVIPNTLRSYKRLGNLVSDGRLAGLIDWSMIEDREREVEYPGHWENPGDIVQSAIYAFRLDRWKTQPWHVEVMVEKKALAGVLIPVCRKWDVRFTANRGYSSQSAMYLAGERFYNAQQDEKKLLVLYLGDHDPSGLDMDRDIAQRLGMFSYTDWQRLDRLALTMEQVEDLDLPENPAKLSDSRAEAYVMEFGDASWELDAVEPKMLESLVENAIEDVLDRAAWNKVIMEEDQMRSELKEFAAKYDKES